MSESKWQAMTIERCAEVMDRRAAIWRNGEQGQCSPSLEEECEDSAAAIRALKSETTTGDKTNG